MIRNPNYHHYVYISVFIIGSLFSKNKSISGTIIDSETRIPIHGANIFSKKLDTGTSSKVDGSFVLKNLSGDEILIEISSMGYKR